MAKLCHIDHTQLSGYSFLSFFPSTDILRRFSIMYVAMTHFQIILGQELLFETLWRERESYLETMPGYRGLLLMRGATEKHHTIYVSQFIWNSKEDFEAWTQSDAFIKAHIQFGDTAVLFKEKPVFEGLSIVIQETAGKPRK